MSKIILYTKPTENVLRELKRLLFIENPENTKFGYMPAEGDHVNNKTFLPMWQEFANKGGAELIYIDNCAENPLAEIAKLDSCTSLMITGGNTFRLLNNLRKSGFDSAIKHFAKRKEAILCGMSAGAIVLGKSIENAGMEGMEYGSDVNDVNLENLEGLNIVNFEVIPHYNPQHDEEVIVKYTKDKPHPVRTIKDEELLVVEV